MKYLITAVLAVSLIACGKTEDTKKSTTQIPTWKAHEVVDKMDGSRFRFTDIRSINKIDMQFPYKGGSAAEIAVMENGNVRIDITKGQVMCRSWDGCTVRVKFDDGAVMNFSAVGPDNGQSGHLYLTSGKYSDSAAKFIKSLETAQRVMISLEVYQEGWPVWEFAVAGFKKP